MPKKRKQSADHDPNESPGPYVLCKTCNIKIQSLFRHNLVACACGRLTVDGGGDYTRILGKPENYQIMEDK